jgi:hypothetical protein
MTLERPMFPPRAEDTDALYVKTDVSPEEIFQAIGRLRKEAREEVDRLIRFLDKTDDYVSRELEDACEDEGAACEDEGSQCEDEGADSDSEPSLGSPECPCCSDGWWPGPNPTGDQTGWGDSARHDREIDGGESGIGDKDGLIEQTGGAA